MSISLNSREPIEIAFCGDDGDEVFRIAKGGRLVAGPGLSNEQASRELFAVLARVMPEMMRDLATTPSDKP